MGTFNFDFSFSKREKSCILALFFIETFSHTMLQKRVISFILFASVALGATTLHAQWVLTNGPGALCLTVSGTNLFAGNENGVFLSKDNGTTWSAENDGFSDNNLYVGSLAASGTNLLAVNGDTVYLSTNNGRTWTAENAGVSTQITSLAVSGSNLLVGSEYREEVDICGDTAEYGGVFFSTDKGTNWTAANAGLPAYNAPLAFAVSGTNLFAGTDGSGVYLSTNNGQSWKSANTGMTTAHVYALAVSGTNIFAGTGSGIFLSTDGGSSWDSVSIGLPSSTIVVSLVVSGTNLFAATNSGVFLSTNSGASWTEENTGLPANSYGLSLAVIGANLFVTTGPGVYRRPLSEFENTAAVSAQSSPTPSGIQIYPNPFSQSTQITFSSQAAGYAEVSIVNMLGVEVARLFSGELTAGEHSFTWDAGENACATRGVYECLVRMNGQVETLPVELMR